MRHPRASSSASSCHYMDVHHYTQVVRRATRQHTEPSRSLGFSSGYVQRAIEQLPRQGPAPWVLSMDYVRDRKEMLNGQSATTCASPRPGRPSSRWRRPPRSRFGLGASGRRGGRARARRWCVGARAQDRLDDLLDYGAPVTPRARRGTWPGSTSSLTPPTIITAASRGTAPTPAARMAFDREISTTSRAWISALSRWKANPREPSAGGPRARSSPSAGSPASAARKASTA